MVLEKKIKINDQFCLRKSNGKFTKKNHCEISKRFFDGQDFLKYTSRPAYITHKNFSKDYAAIHEIKPVLILNKPIYVGFAVPDLSKWKMYDFYYNFIKKNNFDAELLFNDTDSLTYEIKSENVYEEFFQWKNLFDFSNYSKDSTFFNETNKKKLLLNLKMNLVELL